MTKGGKREGAGRKFRNPSEGARISVNFRVAPSTYARMQRLKEKGTNIGELIDELLKEYEG